MQSFSISSKSASDNLSANDFDIESDNCDVVDDEKFPNALKHSNKIDNFGKLVSKVASNNLEQE